MVRAADMEYFDSLNQARAQRQAHGLFTASVFGGRQVQEEPEGALRPAEESPQPQGAVVSPEAPPPPPQQQQQQRPQPQPIAALPPLAPPPSALPPTPLSAALPPAAPPPAAPPPAAPGPAEAARPPPPRPPAYAPPLAAAREPSRAPGSLRVREISANPSNTELERAALAAQYAVASVAPNGETRVPPPVLVEAKPDAVAENGAERLDRSEVDELMLRMEGMLDDEGFCDDDVEGEI